MLLKSILLAAQILLLDYESSRFLSVSDESGNGFKVTAERIECFVGKTPYYDSGQRELGPAGNFLLCIEISDWPDGKYEVTLLDKEGKVISTKIISIGTAISCI